VRSLGDKVKWKKVNANESISEEQMIKYRLNKAKETISYYKKKIAIIPEHRQYEETNRDLIYLQNDVGKGYVINSGSGFLAELRIFEWLVEQLEKGVDK